MVVSSALSLAGRGFLNALEMAYAVWWALVLGFAISAVVQAWVPRQRIERALSGSGLVPVGKATLLGAASSSCSYAAVAIAKSLFQKGASAATALAFQFASTNLVWELGLVLWVLIGWQFTLAEYLGGLVLVALMWALLRLFVSPRLEEAARAHAREAQTGHQHHSAGSALPWRERLTSVQAWSDVAHNFRGDWQMLWKEVGVGFVLAGYAALVPNRWLSTLFFHSGPRPLELLENVVVGPLIAVLTFVCSIGNVPLAAVLWSGGISFAGVIAFIFADLIVLPIVAIYRKYYGTRYALRIVALMFVTMAAAALAVDGIFGAAGLVPHRRPARGDIFAGVTLDYKLVLDLAGAVVFAALFALTLLRGAADPVCGMTVDRAAALTASYRGRTYSFCSEGCRSAFEADPERYASPRRRLLRSAPAEAPAARSAPPRV
ncbi:MAG: uncharacterized protein V7644_1488 [Actinomycetota bacterium]|jgi:uncharacterized membrane protein YraQ (UPF0718 family)/YHS domain-containing protein